MKALSVDKPLDKHLKPVKDSDGTMSALELSTEKVRVKDLDILGEAKGQTPTANDGLATKGYVDDNAGGTAYWIQVWNARAYTRYLNWYMPHTSYGLGYYNWSSYLGSPSLPTSWVDSNNPMVVVPKDCTLTEYNFTGNFTSAQTYEVALLKGTGVTYGSAGNYTLSQVGATQGAACSANILYSFGQTGLSVSLSKGDMLIPMTRRSTTNDSSTYYFEVAFSIVCEVS